MKITLLLALMLTVFTVANSETKPKSSSDLLPESSKVDVRLERLMKNRINFLSWNERCYKVVITDNEWRIKKNEEGEIVGREIKASAALTKKGEIIYNTYSFVQYYENGNFRTLTPELKTSTVIPYTDPS